MTVFARNYLDPTWHIATPDDRQALCGVLAEGHTWSEVQINEPSMLCLACARSREPRTDGATA